MMLSLITVNYNGAGKTIRLLDSLKEQTDQNFCIFVVDNASEPAHREKLTNALEQYPFAQFIASPTNTGFSGGNNLGIKQALAQNTQWIVLINNDAWVTRQFIAGIKAFVSCRTESVIAFPIREADRTAYCGRIEWLKPALSHVYEKFKAKSLNSKVYAIGAGMAIHRSVFEKIGYLDERYFLYFEDADFSMRARHADIPIEIAPQGIHHEVSATTSTLGAPLLLRYHWRNAHVFNWNNGPVWVKIVLPFWSFFAIIRQLLKLLFLPKTRDASLGIITGIIDFYRGRFGKIVV